MRLDRVGRKRVRVGVDQVFGGWMGTEMSPVLVCLADST